MASLRLGQLPVERMVFEPKALDLFGSATAYKEPRAINRRRHERAGQRVGAVGKHPGTLGILERQHQMRVAVAHDGACACLAIERIELVGRLQQQRCPDVAASDNREHVVDLGDLQICEVIEHKAHGHGQAAVGLPIGLTNEAHKRLRNKEAGQRIEIAVNIAHGYKQGAGGVSHGSEVHLMALTIELCRTVESQTHDLFGKDADDARVHALGILRNGVAPP